MHRSSFTSLRVLATILVLVLVRNVEATCSAAGWTTSGWITSPTSFVSSSSGNFAGTDNCLWRFQCPGGQFAAVWVSGSITMASGAPTLTFYNGGAPAYTYSNPTSFNNGVMASGNEASVEFLGGSATMETGAFSVSFSCFAQQCSSTAITSGGTTSTPGTYSSSSSAFGYYMNELCSWTFACPATQYAAVVTAGSTHSAHLFDYESSTHTATATGINFGYMFGSNSGVIALDSSADTGMNGGAQQSSSTFAFKCFQYKCSSPLHREYGGGTILTDPQDIVSSTESTHYVNEICEWEMRCSTLKILDVEVSSTWTWGVFNFNSGPTGASGNFGFQPFRGVWETGVNVIGTLTFDGSSATGTVPTTQKTGWAPIGLKLKCDESLCPSPRDRINIGDTEQPMTINSYPPMATNGSFGRHRFGEDCRWTSSCPAGKFARIEITRNERGHSFYANGAHWLRGNSPNPMHSSYISATNTLTLTMKYTNINSRPSQNSDLTFTCVDTQCTAQQATGQTFFQSDIGNPAIFPFATTTDTYYSSGEVCQWTFTCPGALFPLVRVVGYGRDYFAVDSTDECGYAVCPGQVGSTTPMTARFFGTSNSLVVDINSNYDESRDTGFDVEFLGCYTTRCTSSQPIGTYSTVGGSFTTTANTGPPEYHGKEYCYWDLTCPAGEYAAVVLEGQTYTGNSNDYFRTFEGPGTTQMSTETRNFADLKLIVNHNVLRLEFHSDVLFYQAASTVTFECYPTQCTSAQKSDTITSTGSITNSQRTTYYGNENCRWDFTCPSGEFAAILIAGSTNAAADQYRVYDGTVTSFTTRDSAAIDLKTFVNGNVARVDYTSDIYLYDAPSTVTFECYLTQCGSAQKSETITTTMSITNAQNPTYYGNEKCVWDFTCPASEYAAILIVGQTNSANDVFTVFDGTAAALTTRDSAGIDLRTLVSQNVARVTFNTDIDNHQAASTVTFECYPTQCTSAQKSDTVTSTGTITNGQNPTYYGNENCRWDFTCPSGEFAAILIAGSTNAAVDQFTVYDGTSSVLTTRDSAAIDLKTFVTQNVARVDFKTDIDNHATPIPVKFECYPYQCSSSVANGFFNDSWTPFASTQHATHYGNENCVWDMECLSVEFAAAVISGSTVNSNDYIELYEGTSTLYTTLSGAGIAMWMVSDGFELRVRFISDIDSHTAGLSITLECYDTQCTAIVPAGEVTTPMVFQSTRKPFYYANELCSWDFTCAADEYAVVFVEGSTAEADDKFILWQDDSTYDAAAAYTTRSGAGISLKTFVNTNIARLNFTSDEFVANGGATITFKCYPSQCSSSQVAEGTVTAPIAAFQSASDATHYGNENCVWDFTCPAGQHPAVLVSSLTIGDTADFLHFFDGAGTTNLRSVNSGSPTFKMMSASNIERLQFVSSIDTHGSPFTVQVECYPTQCTSSIDSGTTQSYGAGSTAIMYFDSTQHTDYYDNEDCVWDFQCAAGEFATVSTQTNSGTGTESTDQVNIFSDFGTTLMTTRQNTFGIRTFTTTDKGRITFKSDTNGVRQNGFQMTFECFPTQCSSRDLDSGSTTIGFSGFVGTYDMHSRSQYYGNEVCTFDFHCPQAFFSAFKVTGDTYPADPVSLYRDTTNPVLVQTFNSAGVLIQTLVASRYARLTFVSNLAWYLQGFQFEYYCFPEKCTSMISHTNLTSPGTFDTSQLAIYFGDEACEWNMHCPMGQHVAVKLNGQSEAVNDVFELWSGHGYKYMLSRSGSGIDLVTLVPHHMAQLRFTTDLVNHLGKSTVTWECWNTQCTSSQDSFTTITSPTTFTTTTQPAYYGNEICHWDFSCPSGEFASIEVSGVTNAAADPITVYDGQHTEITTQWGGSVAMRSMMTGNHSRVYFTSDTDGHAAGVTVTFRCHPKPCTSATSTTFATAGGSVTTSAFATHFNNERCTFDFQCPVGEYALVRLNGRHSYGLQVHWRDSVTDATLWSSSSSSGAQLFGVFAPGRDMRVVFDSEAYFSLAYTDAMALELECYAQRCPQQTPILASRADSRALFTAGDVPAYLSDCSFDLQCPRTDSSTAVLANFSHALPSPMLLNGYSVPFSGAQDRFYNQPVFRYVNNASGLRPTSFRLERRCYVAQCSNNLTQPVTLTSHFLNYSTATPSNRYFGDEDCTWRKQCPTNTRMEVELNFDIDGSDVIEVAWGSQMYTYTSSDMPTVRVALGHGNDEHYAYVNFRSHSSRTGYVRILFDCVPSCSSNAVQLHFGGPATIFGDADGSAAGTTYANNERCLFQFGCPAATPYVFLRYSGDLNDNGDRVRFFDSTDVARVNASAGSRNFGMFFLNAASATFWSDASGVGDGWQVEFSCHSTPCLNPQVPLIDEERNIQELIYGENCFYEFKCETGYHAAVRSTWVNELLIPSMSSHDLMLTQPMHHSFDASRSEASPVLIFSNNHQTRFRLVSPFGVSDAQSPSLPIVSLRFECYRGRCSTNATQPQNITHKDVAFPIPDYHHFEKCEFYQSCHSPNLFEGLPRITMTGNFSWTDSNATAAASRLHWWSQPWRDKFEERYAAMGLKGYRNHTYEFDVRVGATNHLLMEHRYGAAALEIAFSCVLGSRTASDTMTVTDSRTASESGTVSVSQTMTTSRSASPSWSASLSSTVTRSATTSQSVTTTATASQTRSYTLSLSPSSSLVATPSMTLSATRTTSLSVTESRSESGTESPSLSVTITPPPTPTPTFSMSMTLTTTASSSETQSMSASSSQSSSVSVSSTGSASLSITASLSRSVSVSVSMSVSQSSTLSRSSSETLSESRSVSSTSSQSSSQSVSISQSVSSTSSSSVTMTPTASATISASVTRSMSISASATLSTSASSSVTESMSLSTTASLTTTTSVSLTRTQSLTFSQSFSQTTSLSVSTSSSLSASQTVSESTTASITVSSSLSHSQSLTVSASVTVSHSVSVSTSVSVSATRSGTWSISLVPTPTETLVLTDTPTFTLPFSVTDAPTDTVSISVTLSKTVTGTSSVSTTVTPPPTPTPTATITPPPTPTPSLSVTVTPPPTPTITLSPIIENVTATDTGTFSDTVEPTETFTLYPELKTVSSVQDLLFGGGADIVGGDGGGVGGFIGDDVGSGSDALNGGSGGNGTNGTAGNLSPYDMMKASALAEIDDDASRPILLIVICVLFGTFLIIIIVSYIIVSRIKAAKEALKKRQRQDAYKIEEGGEEDPTKMEESSGDSGGGDGSSVPPTRDPEKAAVAINFDDLGGDVNLTGQGYAEDIHLDFDDTDFGNLDQAKPVTEDSVIDRGPLSKKQSKKTRFRQESIAFVPGHAHESSEYLRVAEFEGSKDVDFLAATEGDLGFELAVVSEPTESPQERAPQRLTRAMSKVYADPLHAEATATAQATGELEGSTDIEFNWDGADTGATQQVVQRPPAEDGSGSDGIEVGSDEYNALSRRQSAAAIASRMLKLGSAGKLKPNEAVPSGPSREAQRRNTMRQLEHAVIDTPAFEDGEEFDDPNFDDFILDD